MRFTIRTGFTVVAGLSLAAAAIAQMPGFLNGPTGFREWYKTYREFLRPGPRFANWSELPTLRIALIGDSLMEGVQNLTPGDTGDSYAWRHSNLLRRDLRALAYGKVANASTGPPPLGGYDFVEAVNSLNTPILAAPTAYTGGEITGVWTDHRFNDPVPAKGACLRYTQSTIPGSMKKFYRWASGLNLPERSFSDPATSYQFVYQLVPGGGMLEFSVTNFSETVTYASTVVSCASPDGKEHYGMLSPLLPVNQTGAFWVRVRNVSNGGEPVRWEGVNVFAGDETWGIHIINYACGGAIADAYNTNENVAALKRLSPDAVGIWLGHNDVLGRRTNPSQWASQMTGLVDRVKSAMPKASIFLVLGFYYQPEDFLTWDWMHGFLAQLAAQKKVAYFSHHLQAGRLSAEDWAVPMGIKEPWVGHYNRQGGMLYVAGTHFHMLTKNAYDSGLH